MALIKIMIFAKNLNSGSFVKKYPPEAVIKSAGKVAMPNKNIPSAAKSGLEIAAAIKNAPYKSPQGMKPRIRPRA